MDHEGNFKQSSIYTPDAPAWYQRENRSDILLSQDLYTCRALTKEELFVLEGPAKHSGTHGGTSQSNSIANSQLDTSQSSTADEKIARIFYLLQRDLLGSPLAAMILERKSQRDSFYKDGTVFPDAYNTQIGGFVLGRKSKLCAWMLILLLLVVMVVYILYFALQHPSQLQRAWLYTLYVFLCVDCVVISTFEVLINHVWMPYIIKSDVNIVRNIVEATTETFNHVSHASVDAVRPFNAPNSSTTGATNSTASLTNGTSHHHSTGRQVNSRMVRSLQNQLAEDDAAVPNITEFFFVSARLSMYFSDLPEAKLALTYATMLPPGTLFPPSWYRPRHSQNMNNNGNSNASSGANLSRLTTPANERNRTYKTIFSCASFAKVFVNMFQSYVFCSAPTQDLLLQIMLIIVCGIVALISFELYKMLPYLVVAPMVALILLYFVIRLVIYMCRACSRTIQSLSQRRASSTAGDASIATSNDQSNATANDATPPASATHLKPSRAATLEAQRRALINNSAIKRNRVAPNPQNSPTPLAQPDPNAKFSAPRVSPKAAYSQGVVRSFMDDSLSSSEGKSEDENSASEDGKSVEEEKLDLENVV